MARTRACSAFAFASCMPFGMNARQQNAWWYYGGGEGMFNDFLKPYGIKCILAGNTGAQMGGWYRKEIKTVADLKNMKFRVGGVAGVILTRLGVVPQQIAAGDIYPSLEKGTIDAAEWVGPYDDEKLGFHKVAKFYYYPGWWEGGPELDLFVNIKEYNALPSEYKSILESACHEANLSMMAKYDAVNPPALKRLIANGVKLLPFSNDIMAACYKATREVYEDIAAKNAKFKTIYTPWKAFRDEQVQWFSVAEARFDTFMGAATRLRR